MADPLEGVRWKLWLASEHFRALDRELEGFLKSDFYEVMGYQDRKGRIAERLTRVDRPPDTIGLFAGACAHELRCSLDHLMFVVANPRNETEEGHVQFPIVNRRARWRNTRWRMPGVSRGVRTLTESLQPYHRRKWPETNRLWQVRQIDDWDKHRTLAASVFSLQETRLTVHVIGKTSVSRQVSYTGPFKERTVIARVQMGQGEAGAQMRMDKQFVLREIVDQRAPKEVRGLGIRITLAGIKEFIESDVIPRYERFL